MTIGLTQEEIRLAAAQTRQAHWRRWGPYLSDRQWGTVREDYSKYGSAWDYFTHDQARSRAYRWGEDGLFVGDFGQSSAIVFGNCAVEWRRSDSQGATIWVDG